MDDEVYSFALNTALNEIRNVCPDIKNSLVFKEDGEIVAGDQETPKKVVARFVDSFHGIMEKSEAIGGIEHVTLEGSKGAVNISCLEDLYLLTVTPRKADLDQINTVTHVLIPTVLKLLDKIHPASLKNQILEKCYP